jgi:prepilin-type N-terminal cleavage/methylation domain-containing protein
VKLNPTSNERAQTLRESAFTLIEVVVASAVLAIALMGILAICANGLRISRALQQTHVDAGTVAAWTYTMASMTNRLEEGSDSGDFSEMVDDLYPDAHWDRMITPVGSNGLYRVDILVHYMVEKKPLESQLSMYIYKAAGQPGRLR